MTLTAPELLKNIEAAKGDIRPLADDIIQTLRNWVHPDIIVRTALTHLKVTPGEWSYNRIMELGFTADDMDKIAENVRQGKEEREARLGR